MAKFNERPVEYAFVFKCLASTYPRIALDVGTGKTALPALMADCRIRVIAVDKREVANKHCMVGQLDIAQTKMDMRFDFISCVSVLEHVSDPDAAVSNMAQMLASGGHLCLTFPYNEDRYIENIYKLEGAGYGQKAKYPCRVFWWENIANWAKENRLKLANMERWQIFTGEFWTFGERIFPPRLAEFGDLHHLACVLYRLDDINA